MSLLRIFVLVSLTFTAYSFMLSSPFKTMDDQYSIVGNKTIKDPSRWPQLFTQGYFGDRSYYRPLVNLSFMAEYRSHGLNPVFYNLDNLVLHIANALLVWILVGYLVNGEVGFWVGLLFAVHPIQWEAVANISGRAILLSTFFCLVSFIAYLRERTALALSAFAAALLCKESAAILPGILAIHALVNRQALRRLWPWAAVIAGYLWWRHHLGIVQTFPWRNFNESSLGFLTFLRSAITDIRLLILPVDLHFDRSLKMFGSFSDSGALLTVFVVLVAICWLGAARKKLTWLHWLAIGWFALALLPVAQIVTTIGVQPGTISTAEHFLYFACIPVFIVAVYHILSARLFVVRVMAVGVLGLLFLTTIEQNIYATSELAMMERSLNFQPHNARLHSSVGLIYVFDGQFRAAEGHFRSAVEDDPFNARYRICLGKSVCDQGRYKECVEIYDQIHDAGGMAGLLEENRRAAKALLEKQGT